MKSLVKVSSFVAITVIVGGLFVSMTAQGKLLPGGGGGDGAYKKFDACYVSSGDVITQYGNTCKSGGTSCQSNPCGE
jgi:hypothetical protein